MGKWLWSKPDTCGVRMSMSGESMNVQSRYRSGVPQPHGFSRLAGGRVSASFVFTSACAPQPWHKLHANAIGSYMCALYSVQLTYATRPTLTFVNSVLWLAWSNLYHRFCVPHCRGYPPELINRLYTNAFSADVQPVL